MKKLIVAAIVAVGLGMASHASDAETIVSPRITLPTGYEQRQYVTVESGAYVDTDIVATEENDLGFEIVFRESQIPSGTATTPIVGNSAKTDKGANAHWLYFSLVEYSGVWYMGYANAQTNTTNAMKLEVGYHHILFNSGDDRAIIVDGVRGATLPAVPTSQGSNLLLFRRSDIPSRTVFEGELHAFRVFSRTSGEDVANFVPAVETGTSTAGLYDTVRGRFFTAPTDATGSLAAGPAIEDYQRLPRLQFSSGTYVDFGFVVRPEDDCQINFQFDADNYFANKYILGTIGSGIVSGSEVHRWVHLSLYSDKYYYGCAGNKSYDLNSKSVAYSSGVHLCRYNVGDDRQVLFDGSAGMSLYDKPSTNARKLLIGRRETTANYTGYIYDLVITSRVTNAELVHLVPVQGCDSDESGFYDLMRQRFYRPLAGSLTPDLTRGDVVRLEYAEFTSGAFLDTGLKITAENNCRLEFKFAAATTYINDEHVIGTALSSGSEKYIHWTAYSKGNVATTRAWYFGCNGAGDYNTLNKAAWSAGEHDVKYGVGQERQVVLDGAVVGTLPGAPTTGTSTLCIGKRGTAVNFTGKFRTLTVWRQTSDFSSSTKIMHLIPVQDRKTHAVFFYDKVSKTLLSPNGTVNAGPKAVGPVIIIK